MTDKRPRPLPATGPVWTTPIASPNDPELIAAKEELRQKFIDAGVLPAPLVQPTNTQNDSEAE